MDRLAEEARHWKDKMAKWQVKVVERLQVLESRSQAEKPITAKVCQ